MKLHFRYALLALFVTAIFVCPFISTAQMTAGSVPPGTSIQYPGSLLALSVLNGTQASDSFDINCDGIDDLAFELQVGAPWLDFPHHFFLKILNNSIEVCSDSISNTNKLSFYNAGDTLNCDGTFSWEYNANNRIACGEGLCWDGFHELNNTYISFRKNPSQQIGWIKISFDLDFTDTITASIHEILVLCDPAKTPEIPDVPFISVWPNPSVDGILQLKCNHQIKRIEIFNCLGQPVKILDGPVVQALLPDAPGLYTLRITTEEEISRTIKICRL